MPGRATIPESKSTLSSRTAVTAYVMPGSTEMAEGTMNHRTGLPSRCSMTWPPGGGTMRSVLAATGK